MRALLAMGALTIAAALAACTSMATGPDAGKSTSVPAGIGRPRVVTVTCTDRTSDAASLQRAINSSSPGSGHRNQGCLPAYQRDHLSR